jgi:hypothetical protein
MLADIAWKEGRREQMEAHLADAQALVADLPASRAQAAVVNEVARYEMLSGRIDTAVERGVEALAMAEALGLDDLRLRALNTVGVSRGDMGDAQAFADLEQVIELATQVNAIHELLRGWNNLTALRMLYGSIEKTREGEDKTLVLARHYGQHGFVRFVEGGASAGNRYHDGEWDDSLARAEEVIAGVERGARIYQAAAMFGFRGLIRLARGDDQGAESDAEAAIELARPVGDAQAVNPVFAIGALVLSSVGNDERAGETVTEALENLRPLRHLGFGVMEAPMLAWAALQLGREAELVEVLEREQFKSPWLRGALAVAARDFHEAGEICGEIGTRPLEAFFRLQAGAEDDVRRALAFYRSVRATRYIQEAEAVLAVGA